jgi:hypothetical protein
VQLPITLSGSTITTSVTATLHNASTVHMYRFASGAGSASVSADVISSWGTVIRANPDLILVITNSNGNTLATLNAPGITAPIGLGVGVTNINLPSAGT